MESQIHTPVFDAVEALVQRLIVPLVGDNLVGMVQDGEGVDQVSTQVRVHIVGHVFPNTRSILGPVSKVAHQLEGRT